MVPSPRGSLEVAKGWIGEECRGATSGGSRMGSPQRHAVMGQGCSLGHGSVPTPAELGLRLRVMPAVSSMQSRCARGEPMCWCERLLAEGANVRPCGPVVSALAWHVL